MRVRLLLLWYGPPWVTGLEDIRDMSQLPLRGNSIKKLVGWKDRQSPEHSFSASCAVPGSTAGARKFGRNILIAYRHHKQSITCPVCAPRHLCTSIQGFQRDVDNARHRLLTVQGSLAELSEENAGLRRELESERIKTVAGSRRLADAVERKDNALAEVRRDSAQLREQRDRRVHIPACVEPLHRCCMYGR